MALAERGGHGPAALQVKRALEIGAEAMRLDGKVALFSGAAAGVKGELMGFGGATAWLFVREGAKVVLGDINEEQGEKTAAQIRDSGGEAIFVRLDVTREEDWVEAVRTTVSTFGGLDVLLNNAGSTAPGLVEDTTLEMWQGQLDVHAKGTFLGIKHAIPEMRKRGGGSIINISSIMGLVGSPNSPAYSAGKGAIRILSKSAAVQHAKENIRVNSIHPGYCETPLLRRFEQLGTQESVVERTPMGRLGTADEIAYGILYLASDESSYVTGSELVIDGGWAAQ